MAPWAYFSSLVTTAISPKVPMTGRVLRTRRPRPLAAKGIVPTTKAPIPREMKSLRLGKGRFPFSTVIVDLRPSHRLSATIRHLCGCDHTLRTRLGESMTPGNQRFPGSSLPLRVGFRGEKPYTQKGQKEPLPPGYRLISVMR